MRANADIIKELKWQSSGIDFERLPVYNANIEDLDESSIKQFLKNRKYNGKIKLNNDLLKSYGLIASDQSKVYPSTLGILAFGVKPQAFFSEAMMICALYQSPDLQP